MTCEKCKREATIHLTETVDGQLREVHMCPACARKSGLVVPSKPPKLQLELVVQTLIKTHVGELVGELAQTACPYCGLKFMEFRAEGRLGCPHDYGAFAAGLSPILRRVHGATRHVGKMPKALRPRSVDPTRWLEMRAKLRRAVAREDYERAARLRDEIRASEEPKST